MSDRMLVATRKGLLQLARKNGGWTIARTDFPGVAVTAALHDARDGTLYAALKHGHFGTKLHRSSDDGASWQGTGGAGFPADAAGSPDAVPDLDIEAGGADEKGRLWAGALPAGLFRSDDRGEHWELVSALWNVPERAKWFGGGYDDAGIHTISPDPRDARRVFVAISCGGVWDSNDDGKSWALRGDGLVAAYMPPEPAGAREVRRTCIGCSALSRLRPTSCGCSITAGFSASRLMPAEAGRSSNCRATISAWW